MKDRKVFKVTISETEKEFYFKNPSQEEMLALDLEYRKIFAKCLRAGVMSEAETKKLAEKSNAWSSEDEQQVSAFAIDIAALELVVKNEKGIYKEEDISKAVTDLSNKRSKMIEKINEKVGLFSNTAEGLANQQRMHKFAELCLVDNSDNSRFFDSCDSYKLFAENERDSLSEIYKNAYYFEYGEPSKLIEEWPEVKYLKDKVSALSEEAKKASEEESKVEEAETKLVESKTETSKSSRKKSKVLIEK